MLHEPGLWPGNHASYYGAFVRDPDGNNIEAVCHAPGSAHPARAPLVRNSRLPGRQSATGCGTGVLGGPVFGYVPVSGSRTGAIASPGYLKVTYARRQVKDAPSTGTGGALPAGDEEAIFKHCDLACQHGGGGERRLARR